MGPEPRVREAEASDVAAIARLHRASWRVAYRAELPSSFHDALDTAAHTAAWERRLSNPTTRVLVAESEAGILGFCACGPGADRDVNPDLVWEIFNLHIDPGLRGRGIGTLLFRQAVEIGRAAGANRLTLWVVSTNATARRFYEKHGLVADGAEQRHEVGDGVALQEVRYVRDLGSG